MMKKVCVFDFPESKVGNKFSIRSFNFNSYFVADNSMSIAGFKSRWNIFWKKRLIIAGVEKVDELYRAKDPEYMAFVKDFVEEFKDYDLIVMSTFNPVHPEVFHKYLKKPIKILGFIDDPYSTYLRGIPYLWAFDGAFYISKSYSKEDLFEEALQKWGCENSYWWPLCPRNVEIPAQVNEDFFTKRTNDITYVGLPSVDKIQRLCQLKKHYGDQFSLYGRWPFYGYAGIVKGLMSKQIYWGRVKSLSNTERTDLYLNTKIGFNMHVSSTPTETGNMRMYEVPMHGIMLLCDKAGRDAHEEIFEPNIEAVFYDDFEDAISKIDYYLANEDERCKIAKKGFERAVKDYNWNQNFIKFLDWAIALKK